MRVLFDQVVYEMRNKGNIAILQAAVNQIRRLWPEASIEVITASRQMLRLYIPHGQPVNPYSGGIAKRWERDNRFYGRIPRPLLKPLLELREVARYQWKNIKLDQQKPSPTIRLHQNDRPRLPEHKDPPLVTRHVKNRSSSYPEITDGIDLLVATGGQYMSDVVKHLALSVLDRLELGIQRGIPTAMVGQGFGPIEDPDLVAKAGEVLPQVDIILIREKKFAPALLNSLGVPSERVFLTGDDAIEMTYEARSERLGKDIGVGMRVANYTEINKDHLDAIRLALCKASQKHRARLISIPISYSGYEFETDDQVIRKLGAEQFGRRRGLHVFDSPLDLIKKMGKCRLVVTGAFHPAVFALAQGIPAVCLPKSDHYANKFIGLADLFGPGCQVVFLDDVDLQEKLDDAIDSAWRSAEQVRPQLLQAASRQVEWEHAGYKRIYDTVSSRGVI